MAIAKRILSWILWPLLVLGGVAVIHAAITRGASPAISLLALQVIVVMVIALLERWMPEHEAWNVPRDDIGADTLFFIISGLVLSLLLRSLIFSVIPSYALAIWPRSWPGFAQLFLALTVADFGSYATHVITHKVSWVWPIHAPHHSARRLYWLNATRMHPFDQSSTVICSLLPLALLGVEPSVLALFDAFATTHLLLQHSNIRLRQGPLSHVIATAEFHRWHHSNVRTESEGNYATFISLWDHLFRTFRMPKNASAPEDVGLYNGMSIGDRFRDQLRYPFEVWSQRR